MTTLEKVARAIYHAMWEGQYPEEGTIEYQLSLDVASAAVEALREPSQGMLKAAADNFDHAAIHNYGGPPEIGEEWQAMIDHILNEEA